MKKVYSLGRTSPPAAANRVCKLNVAPATRMCKRNPSVQTGWPSVTSLMDEISNSLSNMSPAVKAPPAKTPSSPAPARLEDIFESIEAGNLDEALSLANNALGLTGSLQSSRYVRYLTDFHQSLTEKHAHHSAVRQFTALLAKTYPRLRLAGAA